MKTLDFILPARSADLSAERETLPLPRAEKKSSEPFASLMHRALARPAHEPAEKNSPAKKSAADTRAGQPQKTAPATPRKSKPASRPESPARPESPVTTGADASPDAAAAAEPEAAPDEPVSEAAPPGADSAATPAGDNQASALQQTAVAAYVAGSATPPLTGTAKGGPTTGSPGAGNDSAMIAAIGTGPTVGLAPVAGKNSEPGQPELSEKGKEIPGAESDPAKMSGSTGGAVPIQALMEKAELIDETAASIANPATDKPPASALDARGISAAEQAATMNKAEHAAKVAGTPEPALAGVTVVSALQSAAQARPAHRPAARVESSDAPSPANLSSADRAPQISEASADSLISASSQTELRTRALDRTHDILALHGLRLKETNAGSLHVVIKPGAGLQLSLQLQQTAEGIQAQAVLQQGDFNQLNQHWAELQQRLEERGIKLAPLGQDGAAMNAGGENFQRPSRQAVEQNPLSAGAFAEFASAGATTARTASEAAVASRGWEGWA